MQAATWDLFRTIYRYTGFGILFAIIVMMAMPRIKEEGLKKLLKEVFTNLRKNRRYLFRFLFTYYLFMTLARTLICRDIWFNPWEDVLGTRRLILEDGSLNNEVINNIILFIPLTFLYYLSFWTDRENIKFVNVCVHAIKWSFLFSVTIECCQLFGRLGTFQLSDIVQNTLGGWIGALLYHIIYRIAATHMKESD